MRTEPLLLALLALAPLAADSACPDSNENGVVIIAKNVPQKQYQRCACNKPFSLVVNAGVTIGTRAFDGCTWLTDVQIHDRVQIGANAFIYSRSIQTMSIGKNCTIGENAFQEAFKDVAANLTIGLGTTLEAYAFHNNKHLQKATLPGDTTSIPEHAFSNLQVATSAACRTFFAKMIFYPSYRVERQIPQDITLTGMPSPNPLYIRFYNSDMSPYHTHMTPWSCTLNFLSLG